MTPGARGSRPRNMLSAIDSAGERASVLIHGLDARFARGDRRGEVNDFSAKPNFARVGNDRAAEGLDQRRLAGAVVPDDREDLAGIKVEVGVVERGDAPVTLDEAASHENRFDAHFDTLRIHWSRATATMIRTPMANSCHSTSSPASETAERKTPTISAPTSVPMIEPLPPNSDCAADHHRGDAVEIGVLAGGRADGADAADQRPAGDRRDEAREHVHAEQNAIGIDAREPRGLPVVAGGVDVAAIGGAVEDVPDDGRDREHEERAPHDAGAADCDLIAHDLQEPGLLLDVLHADRFALRIVRVERPDDAERAERDDERRHLEPRHQNPVEIAEGGADQETDRKGDKRRNAAVNGQASHHHRRNDHDDADREIDARRQDDEGLADADNADDHHLGEYGRQIAGGGEPRRIDEDAQQHAEQEHDERHNSRVGVEETLGPLENGETFFVEGGDRRRRAGENLLELLGRGTASRFAHRFLVRFRSPLVFVDPPWAGTRRILFYFRGLSSER